MTLPSTAVRRSRTHILLFKIILFVGAALRVIGFPNLPSGLDVDEVSSSYESWSLLLTHAESWGNVLPVYFSQQGGGQNVLYSYLNIPFIAVFGPTMVGARLLALLVGIATLPLLYITVRRWFGNTTALVAMGLTAIMPWHVMLSHWALESNLLPFTLLLTVYAITRALQGKATFWILISGPLIAVNCYAYGIACVTVSIFTVLLLIFYHRSMRERIKLWVGSGLLGVVMLTPFMLLITKIYLHITLPFDRVLPFSFPTLNRNRLADLQHFGGAPLPTSFKLIFLDGSNDGNANSSLTYGSPFPSVIAWVAMIYILVRVVSYLVRTIRARRVSLPKPTLIELWLVSVPAIWFLIPVIVRETNAFYLPAIVLFSAACAWIGTHITRQLFKLVAAILLICGTAYVFAPALIIYYTGAYNDYASIAFKDMTVPLKAVSAEADGQPIYVNNGLGFNYVYTLWDLKVKPEAFRAAHPTYANPDFENFIFEAKNVNTEKTYWYMIPYTTTVSTFGLSCSLPSHQQTIGQQWRIGQCSPTG